MEPQSALTGADILWKSLECPRARLSRPSAGMHSSFACVHPPGLLPPGGWQRLECSGHLVWPSEAGSPQTDTQN